MKIFLSHSVNSDFQNELYIPLKNSKLSQDHQIFFPHDQEEVVNTKEIIHGSELVLAEVSISATGQGIELGWANSFDIPIICFHKSNTVAAGSLKFIAKEIFDYKDQQEFISKLLLSIAK